MLIDCKYVADNLDTLLCKQRIENNQLKENIDILARWSLVVLRHFLPGAVIKTDRVWFPQRKLELIFTGDSQTLQENLGSKLNPLHWTVESLRMIRKWIKMTSYFKCCVIANIVCGVPRCELYCAGMWHVTGETDWHSCWWWRHLSVSLSPLLISVTLLSLSHHIAKA